MRVCGCLKKTWHISHTRNDRSQNELARQAILAMTCINLPLTLWLKCRTWGMLYNKQETRRKSWTENYPRWRRRLTSLMDTNAIRRNGKSNFINTHDSFVSWSRRSVVVSLKRKRPCTQPKLNFRDWEALRMSSVILKLTTHKLKKISSKTRLSFLSTKSRSRKRKIWYFSARNNWRTSKT